MDSDRISLRELLFIFCGLQLSALFVGAFPGPFPESFKDFMSLVGTPSTYITSFAGSFFPHKDPSEEWRQQLIGRWLLKAPQGTKDGMDLIFFFKDDGTFEATPYGTSELSEASAIVNRVLFDNRLHGTWAVGKQQLTYRFEGTTNPMMNGLFHAIALATGDLRTGAERGLNQVRIHSVDATQVVFDNGGQMTRVQ